MSFYSGILNAKFFDCGESQTNAVSEDYACSLWHTRHMYMTIMSFIYIYTWGICRKELYEDFNFDCFFARL
jgi:hypothetical protein